MTRDLFGDIEARRAHEEESARAQTVELTVCLHYDTGRDRNGAVLVSIDGDEFHAEWIPHSRITSFENKSATKSGTRKNGQAVQLEIVVITLPSTLAAEKRLT